MIKLQDFARECGVTDRQIQRLLKKYEEELTGLFERKGQNGTWLSEEACDILRSKMKQLPPAVVDGETARENDHLKNRIRELEQMMGEKDKLLTLAQKQVQQAQDLNAQLQEKVGRVYALEEGKKDLEGRLEAAEADKEALKASGAEYKAEAEKKAQEAAEAARREQEVREELAAEKARFESMSLWGFLKTKRKKVRE